MCAPNPSSAASALYARAGLGNQLQISTPGFVWPDTLPFADCELKPGSPNECELLLV